jgi:AraC-like DNA-binding protein
VLRVQAALLLRDAEPSWARLAAELEYVDQPHLTREFRRVAGLPPGALVEALGPLATAFVDPGRLRELLGVGSVQDTGPGLRTG